MRENKWCSKPHYFPCKPCGLSIESWWPASQEPTAGSYSTRYKDGIHKQPVELAPLAELPRHGGVSSSDPEPLSVSQVLCSGLMGGQQSLHSRAGDASVP